VLLIPVVSWAVPANRGEALFLWPSLRYCLQRLDWTPDIVVGDMAYISLGVQRKIRERLGVAVLTKLRPDMKLMAPFESGPVAVCPQGQPLSWLGLEERDQLHWFGVSKAAGLCLNCWERSHCPGQFSFAPVTHEILFGRIPLASRTARILLDQVRPWIEPAQSYEKNLLGLNRMFLNSLQLAWTVCLLADAVVLAGTCLAEASQPTGIRSGRTAPKPTVVGTRIACGGKLLNIQNPLIFLHSAKRISEHPPEGRQNIHHEDTNHTNGGVRLRQA